MGKRQGGDERATYLSDRKLCPDELHSYNVDDGRSADEWQVIVDLKTGTAFAVHLMSDRNIPRREVAELLDSGFRP